MDESVGKRSSVAIAGERILIQWAKSWRLLGLRRAAGVILVVGENRASRGASMAGWISAAEERFKRESMLMRAAGGGVDNSSCFMGEEEKSCKKAASLAKSVARYSLPLNGSNSFARLCSMGVRGYTSYGVNRGDCDCGCVVNPRREFMGEKVELGAERLEGVE